MKLKYNKRHPVTPPASVRLRGERLRFRRSPPDLPDRARLRLDLPPVSRCPNLRELGPEKHDQRRIVKPENDDHKRSGGAIGASWRSFTQVDPERGLADRK